VISLSQALAFGLASLIIIVIPGPSVLFVVGRALAYGRRTALVSVVGNELGALVVVCAVAFGVGAVVERSVVVSAVVEVGTRSTWTAVTLYSGQLVAQSELSVVTTFAPLTGWWNVV
jgi:threonine/homoserine/homoserine lactone efflux protein